MTFDESGRDRLAALRPVGPSDAGPSLVAGARARTARADRLASRRQALGDQDEGDEHDPRETPPARRWALSVRAAAAGSLVLLVLAAGVAITTATRGPEVLVSTAQAVPAGESAAVPVEGAAAVPSRSAMPIQMLVHVVGAVQAPGVVALAEGARAVDAVAAAGGAAPDADLSRVNLARPVQDGEQVVVPRIGQEPAVGVGDGAGAGSSGVLDLNSADADALEALPRIGPVLAERILAWRTEHGRFSSVEELSEIPGIGPTLLASLDGLVRV